MVPHRLGPRYRRSYPQVHRVQPVPFVAHRFTGASSSCVFCLGWRDDPRHWSDETSTWNLLGWLHGRPYLPVLSPAQPPPAARQREERERERSEAAVREDLTRWVEAASTVRDRVAA